MEEIEELDAQLTPILTRLVAMSKHLSFEYVCELSDEETIAKQRIGWIAFPGNELGMQTTDDEDTERVDGRGAGVPGAPSALAGAEVDARVSGVG
jgi:hypothetical protein